MVVTAVRGEDIVKDGLVTIPEAQSFTRLSRSKLYLEMDAGRLAYVTLGRRRLIPKRALIEMAAHGLRNGK